jgi:hypothetical protein
MGQCNNGLGGAAAVFPNNRLGGDNCTDVLANPFQQCLKMIPLAQDPRKTGHVVPAGSVNYLPLSWPKTGGSRAWQLKAPGSPLLAPQPTKKKDFGVEIPDNWHASNLSWGTMLYNGSQKSPPLLRSWYAPPGYTLLFCSENPADTPVNGQAYMVTRSGEVVVDACLQNLSHADGTPFLSIAGYNTNGGDAVPVKSCFPDNQGLPNIWPNFPYLLVLKDDVADVTTLQRQSCLNNERFQVGTQELSQVLRPQTSVCDTIASLYCRQNDLPQQDANLYKQCACEVQQQALNAQFGISHLTGKPVASACCLGRSVTASLPPQADGTPAPPCGDGASYQTDAIGKGCCSLAACQQLATNNESLRGKGPTSITCNNGDSAKLPPSAQDSTANSETPAAPDMKTTTIVTHVSILVWITLGLGVFLLAITLSLLPFLSKMRAQALPSTFDPASPDTSDSIKDDGLEDLPDATQTSAEDSDNQTSDADSSAVNVD